VSPDAYVVLILAPLFITGLLLAWFGGKPPRSQVLKRIAIVFCAIVIPFTVLPVYSDQPPTPPATDLIFVCVLMCAFFIKKPIIAVIAAGAFGAQGWFSLEIYKGVLYRPGVTDESPRHAAMSQKLYLKRLVVNTHTSAVHPEANYPSGYLDEMKDQWIRDNFAFDQRDKSPYAVRDYRIEPYWHTRLTGLWHAQTRATRVWFDGGKLDNPDAYHVRGFGPFIDSSEFHVHR